MTDSWLRRSLGTYFGNATAVRDYRAQLRGNRSIVLWALYLLLMIGYAMIFYSSSQSGGYEETISVAALQDRLRSFYESILYFLGTMILFVAPGLTATTIVAERQRRSLDLVFSAPVTPKYYLVGKMLSSYRYTWMLLVLSFPVTAVCVVLGGASFGDVLAVYALLSFQALILTSIALLVSTQATNAVGAIATSYFFSAVYAFLTSGLASGLIFTGMGRQVGEMSFLASLSPYFLPYTANSYSVIFGIQIPNWILAGLASLLFCKITLLGAGSVLAPSGSKETVGLRIHGIVYAFLAVFLVASSTVGWAGMRDLHRITAAYFTWMMLPVVFLAPSVVCFGWDLERKHWPDGFVTFRGAILGRPSGGLVYLLLLLGAAFVGAILAARAGAGSWPGFGVVPYLVWSVGFWTAIWGAGRWLSSALSRYRAAQTLLLMIVMMALILPPMFLSQIDSDGSQPGSIWSIYVLTPLFFERDRFVLAIAQGIGLTALGWAMALMGERALKRPKSRFTGPPPVLGS